MKPKRLILSIYLVALIQLLTAWLGFSVSKDYLREPPGRLGPGGWEAFAAQHVALDRGRPAALRETLDWLRVDLGIQMTLYDPAGHVLASSHARPPEALPAELVRRLPVHGFLPAGPANALAVGIYEANALVAYVISDRFQFRRPLSRQVILAGIMLSLLLLGSLLFARSLASPLRRLANAARAFGGGQLDARVRLDRRDELGAVANAFDDMAERVTLLLRGQRELLANVSHELRTPLARIRVALDLAVEGDATAAREALANIGADWADLDRLVEDMLAAARLDLGASGSIEPAVRRTPVDLRELVSAARDHLKLHASGTLELELCSDPPLVEGDPMLLRRVVDGLLDNARKYSDPERPILLQLRLDERDALLTVSDHGAGIDPADLPHICTPFFRADRSRARQTGGAGLGLTLAQRIIAAHGGHMEITSQLGQGTRVDIRLPRVASASSNPCPTHAHVRTSSVDAFHASTP